MTGQDRDEASAGVAAPGAQPEPGTEAAAAQAFPGRQADYVSPLPASAGEAVTGEAVAPQPEDP